MYTIRNLTKNFGRTVTQKNSVILRRNFSKKILTLENMNSNIKKMEYAVRGPIVTRAAEIEKELKTKADKPFKEVLRANIGDCHAMGQKPITFFRQVLALVTLPILLNDPNFPEDAKDRACDILNSCRGGSVGSYTDSPGIEMIRREAAKSIERRDGIASSWNNIILSSGASEGIKSIVKLLNEPLEGKKSGIMAPIPQYPLYSATITEFNMHMIGYYLDEDNNWALDICELKRAIEEGRKLSAPRAIVVINPGNPTGQVLSRENIEEIIKFAYDEELLILADEVYQHNVYKEGAMFHSFKKVLTELGAPYDGQELVSFMSCSKGYMGECGLRGAYMEATNLSPEVMAMLLKSVSSNLCPNVIGQALMYCVVNPPQPKEPSYGLYKKEKDFVLGELKKRAKMAEDTFNSIPGFYCNEVMGAMYAFPRFDVPPKAMEAAKKAKLPPDTFYAFELLENTGICIIPGSGFQQQPGTYHFRTTILPQTDKLEAMLKTFKKYHEKFLKKYS